MKVTPNIVSAPAIFAAVVLVVYGRTKEFQYLLEMTVRKLKKKLRGGE